MSFRLSLFTNVVLTLSPDEAMFFRLNRLSKVWIERRILTLSKGWFEDLRQRVSSSIILLQLKRRWQLCNEYICHKVDNYIMELHPLQCTSSVRILKLLLAYGSDPETTIPRYKEPRLLNEMLSYRTWVPEYLSPPEGKERVLDYCVKVKDSKLALLLHERGVKLPPHADPILFVDDIDEWFPKRENPLSLVHEGKSTLLTCYKGRALILSLRPLIQEGNYLKLRVVVISNGFKSWKGIDAIEMLDAIYTPSSVCNHDAKFSPHDHNPHHELIYPHYLIARSMENKSLYLQFPLAHKEEYEQGVQLAHELYAAANKL